MTGTGAAPSAGSAQGDPYGATPRRFAGPLMVLLAFLVKNLSVGLTYGTFGVLLAKMTMRFDAKLSVVSLGLPLVVLSGGVLAPLAAYLIRRLSIRITMLLGVVLAAAGYAGAAFARDSVELLLCFGFLIGPGVTLMGLLPCYVLVSNWYVRGQGRAIGIVDMPVGVMVMPPLTTIMGASLGYPQLMLFLAAGYLLALPLVAFVVDRPELVRQMPFGSGPASESDARAPALSAKDLLRKPTFILLLLGFIATIAPAVTVNVHLVPLLIQRGLQPGTAAALLSVYGGAAAGGSLLYGWLADRVGPKASLLLNAVSQMIAWGCIAALGAVWPLGIAAAILGAGVGGASVALSVLITRLYGPASLGRALGLMNFVGLPVIFLTAPLTAAVRENTGSYGPALAAFAIALAAAAACWALAGRRAEPAVSLETP